MYVDRRLKEICLAKSNLLAPLFRSEGISAGFCYQLLMIFDTREEGYSLHTLHGVYLKLINCWISLDALGDKPGVPAKFSVNEKIIAFPIREEFDEKNHPIIYTYPKRED